MVTDNLELLANALLYTKSLTSEHIDEINRYLLRKLSMREAINRGDTIDTILLEAIELCYVDIVDAILSSHTPSRLALEEALTISVSKEYDLFVRDIIASGNVSADAISHAFMKVVAIGNYDLLDEVLKARGIPEHTLKKVLDTSKDFIIKDKILAYARKEGITAILSNRKIVR